MKYKSDNSRLVGYLVGWLGWVGLGWVGLAFFSGNIRLPLDFCADYFFRLDIGLRLITCFTIQSRSAFFTFRIHEY